MMFDEGDYWWAVEMGQWGKGGKIEMMFDEGEVI